MVKKCVYCKTVLDDNSVVDVCVRCGIGVWGENMFRAIVENMESARESGDLFQGSVTSTQEVKPKREMSFVTEAKQTLEQNQEIQQPEPQTSQQSPQTLEKPLEVPQQTQQQLSEETGTYNQGDLSQADADSLLSKLTN